ncbi:MAG: glutathione S-transferase family protein [Natronospirillum sp.]
MKLYGSYTSPYVRHCRLALLETGAAYEFVEANYSDSARLSPASRVPFLRSETVELNDSASILKYVREQGGQDFLSDVQAYDLFCLVNTAQDASINLFLLEKEGVTPANTPYMERQASRVASTLIALNDKAAAGLDWHDGSIRLACFVEWTQYRKRIDFTPYPALLDWLEKARTHDSFVQTAPPAA